jgi:hypothetical protein
MWTMRVKGHVSLLQAVEIELKQLNLTDILNQTVIVHFVFNELNRRRSKILIITSCWRLKKSLFNLKKWLITIQLVVTFIIFEPWFCCWFLDFEVVRIENYCRDLVFGVGVQLRRTPSSFRVTANSLVLNLDLRTVSRTMKSRRNGDNEVHAAVCVSPTLHISWDEWDLLNG